MQIIYIYLFIKLNFNIRCKIYLESRINKINFRQNEPKSRRLYGMGVLGHHE